MSYTSCDLEAGKIESGGVCWGCGVAIWKKHRNWRWCGLQVSEGGGILIWRGSDQLSQCRPGRGAEVKQMKTGVGNRLQNGREAERLTGQGDGVSKMGAIDGTGGITFCIIPRSFPSFASRYWTERRFRPWLPYRGKLRHTLSGRFLWSDQKFS